MEGLWKRYRPFVYGAAALLIGAVALNEFVLRPQMEESRAERAKAFESAASLLEDGDYAEAQTAFKNLVDSDSKISPLAAQYLAQAQYEGGGDAAGAARSLSDVAAFEGDPYARLSILKSAYFTVDNQSLSELESSLGSLLEDPGALGSLARELVAAKAFESGDIARARAEFNRLRFDAAAPEGVKRRADIALAAIPAAPEAEIPADIDTQEETGASAPDAPAETEETGQ
ncbi:hypothetical protein HY3_16335 [Hyphomonas pacifica]|uniref:Tetratricopeptide repeat-like domain-containing protein n=2 Tax=Hyphomonas pacifica TaxID=1280941 RepID=A0A8B2PL12_9PROT|nr:hypothetical protein HY3_16335 [Hyphomonas pacifica]